MFAYELRVYDNENDNENEDEDENSYLEAIHHPSSINHHPSTNLLLLQFLWYAESSV